MKMLFTGKGVEAILMGNEENCFINLKNMSHYQKYKNFRRF